MAQFGRDMTPLAGRRSGATRSIRRVFSAGCEAGGPMPDAHADDAAHRWSARVTRESDALDLRAGVFTLEDPRAIARSLKRSAEQSHRRKSDPYRSAMSMLTFYINRAGDNLTDERRKVLEAAKDELRSAFRRQPKRGTDRARGG
jgi:hypothetical protein